MGKKCEHSIRLSKQSAMYHRQMREGFNVLGNTTMCEIPIGSALTSLDGDEQGSPKRTSSQASRRRNTVADDSQM